jgi:hypothetical protein
LVRVQPPLPIATKKGLLIIQEAFSFALFSMWISTLHLNG